MTELTNDIPSDIGSALIKLQSHIHDIGAGPKYGITDHSYFTGANIAAQRIVASWILHPKGRGWCLIQEIDNFIKEWPAD